jgi:hypothetical protein
VGYEVNAGRVHTWSLEVHLVDHCNLRCANCCTLSPELPERAVAPESLARDLAAVGAVLRPATFKLTGGEPLLHREIVRCVEIARASGVADVVSVTTNGHLAPRMPEAFWRAVQRVQLSRYPSAPLPPATLALIRERCATHGVALAEKPAAEFQVLDAPAPHDGAPFATCWLRHRCHMLHEGRFFACTRPPHLAATGRVAADAARDDGVDVHEPELLARLVRYLERAEPLTACRVCLGATGAWTPHAQLRKASPRTAPA